MIKDEMIDRAAKAAYDKRIWIMTGHAARYFNWDERHEGEKQEWREITRAVIEAMREPTDAMVDAGDIAAESAFDNGSCASPHVVWQRMIDAVLTGETS